MAGTIVYDCTGDYFFSRHFELATRSILVTLRLMFPLLRCQAAHEMAAALRLALSTNWPVLQQAAPKLSDRERPPFRSAHALLLPEPAFLPTPRP